MDSVAERLARALSDRYRIEGELGAAGMATDRFEGEKAAPEQMSLSLKSWHPGARSPILAGCRAELKNPGKKGTR